MNEPDLKNVTTEKEPSPDVEAVTACEVKDPSHEPLMRMKKRGNTSLGMKTLVYGIGFLLALIVGALLLIFIGKNPIMAYWHMLVGSFGTSTSASETIRLAVPLLIAGIAVAFSFKMKFWNIGGEGQILAGAIMASHIVIAVHHAGNVLPTALLHIFMIVMALIGGAIFGFLPAFFKTKWGTNETLFTLMLNYVAIYYIGHLAQLRSWQNPKSTYPKIINFREFIPGIALPKIFGVHIGWIVALILAVLAFFYLKKTKHGYEISVVGDSLNTARYAGMNTRWIRIRTLIISGALCGLAGYLQVAGADYTLTDTTAGGVGFTAITVAWLSKLNPFVMIPVSVFIAMLQKGSLSIQSTMRIPASAADLLTGLILFFMLGSEFFIRFRIVFRKKRHKKIEEETVEVAS